MKRVEFGICGLDTTISPKDLTSLFQVPPGCCVEPIAAFQLAYQGYPWKPAKGYEKDSDTTHRRYPHGETYPAWFEIDQIAEALGKGTKLSFHLNETEEYRYVSGLLQGEEDVLQLIQFLCEDLKARHIQVNVSSRGVKPELFMASEYWESSALQILRLAEKYPETLFIIPVFERGEISSLAFVLKIMELAVKMWGKEPLNVLAFFDNSGGEGKVPEKVAELPVEYPRHKGHPVGFTGGLRAGNVKEWLSRYSEKATDVGCWLVSDAQSGFRKNGSRGEPIDVEQLKLLMKEVFEWGSSGSLG